MKPLLCALLAAAASFQILTAANPDPADLTIDENIATPAVPKKAAAAVKKHMADLAASLTRHGLSARADRQGEVVSVTIPCSALFPANSAALGKSAPGILESIAPLLKYPTMYKVIIAVHSDNTGETAYLDNLTAERANALDDLLCRLSATEGTNIIPYGMAADDPIDSNDTVTGRDANRRVEINIVPEWQMIAAAKSGRLK